jgi:hypothetical protein
MNENKTFSAIPMRTWRWLGVNEALVPEDLTDTIKKQQILVEAGQKDQVIFTNRDSAQYEVQVHIA